MSTDFEQLNHGWNAEPNAPAEQLSVVGECVTLEFYLNAFIFHDVTEEDRGRLIFGGVAKYRLGPTNDEGWNRGQCRFSGLAPRWGEFYAVAGDLRDEEVRWVVVARPDERPRVRYLFYLRDSTFECDAVSWRFEVMREPNTSSPDG